MSSRSFDYAAPKSVADAVALLGQTPDTLPLAGGHELLTQLRLRQIPASRLVDLRNIPALRSIDSNAAGTMIGAMARLAEIAANAKLQGSTGALVDAIASVGDVQTRNMATIGGSLASADGANDVVAALLVLEAQVEVSGPRGMRLVTVPDLIAGGGAALRAANELIVGVQVPEVPTGVASAYAKFKNPANSYPICGVAVAVGHNTNGNIGQIRIAVTGATKAAKRLTSAEAALAGKAIADIKSLATGLLSPAEAVTDMFASADYRAHLVDVLAAEAIAAAVARLPAAG